MSTDRKPNLFFIVTLITIIHILENLPIGNGSEIDECIKDKCGVCEGNNDTCEEHTGTYYHSDLYKKKHLRDNHFVTIIPKGAYNILIKKPPYYTDFSMALRDDEKNYLIQPIQIFEHKPFDYGGVTFKFKRNFNIVQVVISDSWQKLNRDLVVEIQTYQNMPGKLYNETVLLTYKYLMDKPNLQ